MFAYCNNNPIILKDSQGGIPNFAIDITDGPNNIYHPDPTDDHSLVTSGTSKSPKTQFTCSYTTEKEWCVPQNSNSVVYNYFAPKDFSNVITDVYAHGIAIEDQRFWGEDLTVYLVYYDAVVKMDIEIYVSYHYSPNGSDNIIAAGQLVSGLMGAATTIGGLPGNCGEIGGPWFMQIK